MEKQTYTLILASLLLLRGGNAPLPETPPAFAAAADLLLYEKPGGTAQALLVRGTQLTPMSMDESAAGAAGWTRVSIEGWVRQSTAQDDQPPSLAPTLLAAFEEASAASDTRSGRVPIKGLRLRTVEQISAKARGSNVQIDYQVVVENRTGIALANLELEFALLDRRGRALATQQARLTQPEVLAPRAEGTFRFKVEMTRSQQRDYHRRRYRTAFFLAEDD
ncbi:MAG: hypothetical protein QF724_04615 [Planctomycetota bacterium]|jgi:hypothetical protein|nr:hypothetical protein [Planctomycetota bacterium]MDP6367961.1 hypothetical protein [Planctomycetota bacterium]MDP6838199.1 hypothetical protein [Planctomycetota bacterium]MDP6956360.1 hypothetical protein [Planctomycetota bacterium]